MYLKHLEAKNFLSFESLNLDFKQIAVAIQGENLDDEGQEANGTGKSSIFYILEYMLMASTSNGSLDADLVRWGEKSAYGLLEIYCPSRKQTLQIERNIKSNPKLSLNIVEDGGTRYAVDFATVIDGNKQIFEWIGIAKEDLQNYYLISSKRYQSFMTSPNSAKLEMISRLVNLKPLSSADKVIEEEVGKIESKITQLQIEKSRYEGNQEATIDALQAEHERDLEAELEASTNELLSEIEKVELKKNSILKSNTQYEAKISDLSNSIDELNKTIASESKLLIEPKTKQKQTIITTLDGELKELSESISTFKSNISEIKLDLSDSYTFEQETKKIIQGSVTCPKCSFKFNASNLKVSIVEAEQQLKDIEEVIAGYKSMLTEQEQDLKSVELDIDKIQANKRTTQDEIDSELHAYQQKQTSLLTLNNQLKTLVQDKTSALKSIESNLNLIVTLDKQIDALNKQIDGLTIGSIDQVRIKELEVRISEINDVIASTESLIVAQQEELSNIKKWEFRFKKFVNVISQESLAIITSNQNRILSDMKSELRVQWEGFKLNSDGSTSDKFTPTIIRNGIEKPFSSFSGGERGRIEYSSILTNQYLINSTHPHGGLRFLMTDEVVEGIDSLGLSNTIEALNRLNMTILITTHVINQNTSANVMIVRKQGGKSVIVNN